jgi:meso-butanediol dehydrogenase / (S,S)-butanediol dehydrogenase / diacetyl reductase
MYNLNNKVAIITGSGRHKGIGESIALRLASEGCNIVLSDIKQKNEKKFDTQHIGNQIQLQEIEMACKQFGVKVITILCDVRKESECENLIQSAVATFGKLDILVNNAGIGFIMEPFTEFKEESWDAVLGVNLKGAFLCSKHAAIQMKKQATGGSIVNIASQAAKSGFPFAAAYTASKHGLIGLTRSNAVELGKHKIRVNAVCPNHITTGLGDWQNKFFSEKMGMDYDTYLQAIIDKNPLERTGLVQDISKAVAFLCSDEASYITGEAMNVSGGEEYH